MKDRRSLLIRYGVTVLLAGLTAWGVLRSHGFSQAETAAERCGLLCDAFFVPGILLLCAGALIFVHNQGGFTGVAYAARYVARMFVPWSGKRDESYGDFVEARREKGKVKNYAFLFVVGGAFFAVSLVFLILFYRL